MWHINKKYSRIVNKNFLVNEENCIFPRFVSIAGKCCIHGSHVLQIVMVRYWPMGDKVLLGMYYDLVK